MVYVKAVSFLQFFFPSILTSSSLRLSRLGLGCHFGCHSVGALGYADDIALLAPSLLLCASYSENMKPLQRV